MVCRLRDHIERLDDGVVYAADDLAVVLRALICPGDGNRVLMRLYDSTRQPVPNVLVSRPASADPDVFFAVGSIPTELGAEADGAINVALTAWMNTTVLVVQGSGSRRTYTWAQFLNEYANKWGGAHLDRAVPAHLRMIDNHAAAGMPLSNYLMRTAAVQVWFVAQALFRDLLLDAEPAVLQSATLGLPNIPSDQREDVIFVAPGGLGSPPRDISPRGLLQAFCHRTNGAELVWYVDEASPDNALHLTLGSVPYDVRYGTATVPAAEGPVDVRAARQPDHSKPIVVEPGSLKNIMMNGRVRTLTEVRGPRRASNEPGAPD
jgi:hypothetical protein